MSQEIQNFLQTVRCQCLEQINRQPELYYPQDIENLKTKDWMIMRFLHQSYQRLTSRQGIQGVISHGDETRVTRSVIKMMQWMKDNQVRELGLNSLPQEVFRAFVGIGYTTDDDTLVIHVSLEKFSKTPSMNHFIKDFVSRIVASIDPNHDGKRGLLMIDCTGMSLLDVDLDLSRFLIHLAVETLPHSISKCILYCCPWFVDPIIRIACAVSMTCNDIIMKVSRGKLLQSLDLAEVPISLGGKLDTQFIPKDCMALEDYCARLGLDVVMLRKFLSK